MRQWREPKDAKFEQLVAGAITRFGQIDTVGLTLLSGGLLLNEITISDEPFTDIVDYIEYKGGTIKLKEGYDLEKTTRGCLTLREKLENYQGSKIKNYLTHLNVENFVMRKIKQYSSLDITKRANYFSPTELAVLDTLLAKGYVTTRWNDDYIPQDFEEYVLTKKGEVQLFKEDNADLLVNFILDLESQCYDPNLLDDFLQAQNLNDKPQELLTLFNFEIFGSLYDRDILSANASIPSFKELHFEVGRGYDRDSRALITDLLEVLESDHSICICHPNHIFKNKPVTKNNPQITRINWDNIDPARMIKMGDYLNFVDVNSAYRYAHNRLKHQLLPAIKQDDKDITKYLVVVEKYRYDNVDNYVVRGLIKGEPSSISIAFNPEYAKTITRDIWSKGLRMGDNETPNLYLKRQHSISNE